MATANYLSYLKFIEQHEACGNPFDEDSDPTFTRIPPQSGTDGTRIVCTCGEEFVLDAVTKATLRKMIQPLFRQKGGA